MSRFVDWGQVKVWLVYSQEKERKVIVIDAHGNPHIIGSAKLPKEIYDCL